MTYQMFLFLMQMHQEDPEGVQLFLEDQEFRDRIIQKMRKLEAEAPEAAAITAALKLGLAEKRKRRERDRQMLREGARFGWFLFLPGSPSHIKGFWTYFSPAARAKDHLESLGYGGNSES